MDEEIKLCKIRKKFKNIQKTTLFKYPEESNLEQSVFTLGFCQKKKNRNYIFAKYYIEIVYLHMFKGVDSIKTDLYWKKFNGSTWVDPKEDGMASSLVTDLEKIGLECISEFLNTVKVSNPIDSNTQTKEETTHTRGRAI